MRLYRIQLATLTVIVVLTVGTLIALAWHLEAAPHLVAPPVGTVSHAQNEQDLQEGNYFYRWNAPDPNFPAQR